MTNQYSIYKKQAMFTTVNTIHIPVLVYKDFATTIPEAADKIASLCKNFNFNPDDYVICENPDWGY